MEALNFKVFFSKIFKKKEYGIDKKTFLQNAKYSLVVSSVGEKAVDAIRSKRNKIGNILVGANIF